MLRYLRSKYSGTLLIPSSTGHKNLAVLTSSRSELCLDPEQSSRNNKAALLMVLNRN